MTITATPTGLHVPGYGFSAKPSVKALQADTIRVRLAGRVYDIPVIDIDAVNSTTYTGEQTAAEVVQDIYDGLSAVAPGSPYTLTLTYTTGNAPSQTLGQWNTQLGGNYTAVNVVADSVILTGGINVSFPAFAFSGAVNLIGVSDDGSVLGVGDNCFDSTGLESVVLTGCASVGANGFTNCLSLTNIDLPACNDLGGSTGDDGVFDAITGNTITATFRASLATCDGGNPDGDIVELDSSNTCTINYV